MKFFFYISILAPSILAIPVPQAQLIPALGIAILGSVAGSAASETIKREFEHHNCPKGQVCKLKCPEGMICEDKKTNHNSTAAFAPPGSVSATNNGSGAYAPAPVTYNTPAKV